MMQVPTVQTPQYQIPVQQPTYNAVKIDINNPQVNATPAYAQNPQTPPVLPVYNSIPAASVYEVPQQSIYQPQSVITKPLAMQEVPSVPPPVIVQPSVKQPEAQVVQQAQPEAQVQAQPKAEPQPQVTTQPQAAEQPQAPAAVEAAPKTVEVKAPEVIKPQLDLNEFISKLTSSDYEVQATTMASIAEMVQATPQVATELLDVKIIETLQNIMSKDSSKLEGPTPQQLQIREKIINGKPVTAAETVEANKITPMEQAERNKLFAIYTTAVLDKLYASEIEKIDKTVVQITELPGAAGIVEQIKNNPNPMVKIAGIDAMSYIQRPEYKQDLTTLFTVAKNDKDPNVQKVAELALNKLEKLPAEQKQ